MRVTLRNSLVLILALSFSAALNARGIEDTVVWDIAQFEKKNGRGSEEVVTQVEQILLEMRATLGERPDAPSDDEEAIATLKKLSAVLAMRNFVQPPTQDDWTDTVSDALTDPKLTPSETEAALSYHRNLPRLEFIDSAQSVYFMDCDIASLFIISVGQMVGWDMRLVTVPKHAFLRWEYEPGKFVNWDWTHWRSRSDQDYAESAISALRGNAAPVRFGAYLRSQTHDETRASFFMLPDFTIESMAEKKELVNDVLELAGTAYSPRNNIAWAIVTNPASNRNDHLSALSYALSAWSMDPTNPNVADTVACAFGVLGDRELGAQISNFAIETSFDDDQQEVFRENQASILAGGLCKD